MAALCIRQVRVEDVFRRVELRNQIPVVLTDAAYDKEREILVAERAVIRDADAPLLSRCR